jgi:hypothetical protein
MFEVRNSNMSWVSRDTPQKFEHVGTVRVSDSDSDFQDFRGDSQETKAWDNPRHSESPLNV